MIYYFSATGNTRHIAGLLAQELGDEAQPITDVLQGRAETQPFSVLCFPVHGWRVPKIVVRFLEGIREKSCGDSLYAVMTCGDDCGKAVRYLRQVTDALGISIAGAFSVTMPESYVGLPFMDVDTKEREAQKIRSAEERVKTIAGAVRSGATGIYDVHEGGAPWLKSKVIGGVFHHLLITDKTFRADASKCIACGRCAEVCPVGNIAQTTASPPQWLHNGDCLTCLACYHVCPRHAISFNWQTRNKGQYRTLIKG